MKNLIKAEIYKCRKDYAIWVIALVLIACASISIFTGVYDSAETAFRSFGKDIMVIILSCAVYAGLSLTDEFTNRTIIHSLTCGNGRSGILLAKCLHYLWGCSVITIVYLSFSTLIAVFSVGCEGEVLSLMGYAARCLAMSLPLYWGVSMVFFLVAVVTRKGAVTMGISVAVSILTVVLTNKAYFAAVSPSESLLRLSPVIQIPRIFEGAAIGSDYWIAIMFALAGGSVLIAVSGGVMGKAEL